MRNENNSFRQPSSEEKKAEKQFEKQMNKDDKKRSDEIKKNTRY